MKSLLIYASLLTIVTLTACGSTSFDITLENGSDLVIETENIQITNQELFYMVATQTTGGTNAAVSTILDWADYIILSDLFEIDEDRVAEELEMLQGVFDEDQLAQLLLAEGFVDLDTYTTALRLQILREQAVADAIYISEEEILEIYNEWFLTDENLDLELGHELAFEDDDLDLEDEDEIDVPELEGVREDIENWLSEEATQDPAFEQEVLANLRYEAGLIIHSRYLTGRYEDLLDSGGIEYVNVNPTSSHETAIVTLGEHTITVDELFDTVIARFALAGQSSVLRYIDLQILDEIFVADRDQVRANISEAKVNMLNWFYPQMNSMGLTTEREIFDHFLFELLRDLAFEANFEPDEARVQELYETYVPHRNVSHILVDTYEEAADLITELKEVDGEDFAELFSELAYEYSSCGSSHDGGSLGSLTIPSQMVEEFEVAAFALGEGEFTDVPVETQFGYHIIFVDEIEDPLTLDEHRENEMQNLRLNPEHFANLMIGLRAERNIVFHNMQLQAQYDAIVLQNEASLEENDDFSDDFEDDDLGDDE